MVRRNSHRLALKAQIDQLIKTSREVVKDCALENGAIVAVNIDKSYVHREAANYRWVWPRDAAFVCVAADILKIPIQKPFFQWLEEYPQDFARRGILYANYATNGRIGSMGTTFQPDQSGAVLWAVYHHYQKDLKKALEFKDLIEQLANGLVNYWDKTCFSIHTVDIWEETHRHTSATMENNFTYSLAACARGLLLACEILSNSIWKKVAEQMIEQIKRAYHKKNQYFYRMFGRINDKNVDASLLGLSWPFEIYDPKSEEMINMIKKIEEKIVINGGVHRYQFDYYDGEGSAQEGGGVWPVLNFWLAIVWFLAGDKTKALNYYLWVLRRLNQDGYKDYIPEQIFDDFRKGIYPLAWSHSMFVIASHYLGYI